MFSGALLAAVLPEKPSLEIGGWSWREAVCVRVCMCEDVCVL